MRPHPLLLLPALLALWLAAATARAAQDYDSCTGYIDALPAVITTQGTWCLRGHKYTSQVSGQAINVLADNVTIDCNHFRLTGLGAGPNTNAIGIVSEDRLHTTVRRCRVQGFLFGVSLTGAHHLVEDNRLELNTQTGLFARGDYLVIRDNLVLATGGRPDSVSATGIDAIGLGLRVEANMVDGVSPAGNAQGNKLAIGIFSTALIADNFVGNLHQEPGSSVYGIASIYYTVVRGNTLMQGVPTEGIGILAVGVCRDNTLFNFQTGISGGSCVSYGTNHVIGTF